VTLPGDLPALARASVAAALGREGVLRRDLRAAIAAGATPRRLDETLLQLVPFAGFARAINAFSVLREFLPPAAPAERRRTGFRRRGVALCRRIYGPVYGKMIGRMRGFHPALADWILEEGYGRVLSRPVLSIRERELIVVALLSALKLPMQLESHVRGSLRVGATAGEVAAMRKAGSRR
jgi:alkylhydroperoxidase/carboxymuconolactone decarboxylase family protein YurZ